MMTPREVILRTIDFSGPDRLGLDLPGTYGCDVARCGMSPSPDARPPGGKGVDEWGAVWHNIGVCAIGEVKEFPLATWDAFPRLKIPDFRNPRRYESLQGARDKAGDRFLLSFGVSLYERIHYIRGLENTWADIYEEPENLRKLINLLVDMNLYALERFAAAGCDGYLFPDDWGLQDRLMIAPEKWREFWKPAYARIYAAAHAAGLRTFLHSCGHIVAILDDLIEVGLDVIHMDQQENMGLELLGRRFGGRLTFYSPVDIQATMSRGNLAEIRAYARRMVRWLGRPNGGLILRWHDDPKGSGHSEAALEAMCDEFGRLSREFAANPAIAGTLQD